MKIYGILNIVDSIATLALAGIVAIKGRDKKLIIPFGGWTLSISIWSFGVGAHAFSDINLNAHSALFWSRFLHYGAVFIPSFYTHFVLNLCDIKNKKIPIILYSISLFFMAIIPFNIFISNVSKISPFNYFPKSGIVYPFYVVYLFACVLSSIYLLIVRYQRISGIEKNQTLYMIVASCITYTFGTTAFLPMFNIPIFPFGTPFVTLNALIIGYTIMRYRLMEFSLIIRWGLAYSMIILTLIFVSVPIIILSEWISRYYFKSSIGFLSLTIACLVSLIFEPLKKNITRFVDQFIFNSPDFQSILKTIEDAIRRNSDLTSLACELSAKLKTIWGAHHGGFAIWNFRESGYQLFPKDSFSNLPFYKLANSINSTDFLVRTLETERRLFKQGIVIEDEVRTIGNKSSPGEKTTFSKILRTMRWLGATICIPIFHKEKLIGFIILGKKQNNTIYNDEDKKFLAHVADILSKAINNIFVTNNLLAEAKSTS